MSALITRTAVRNQLAAMAGDRFDIGVLLASERMLLRGNWSVNRIESALTWLRQENAHGAHIFVRPHGVHQINLIDDLSRDAISWMRKCGFQPALVIETSPGNFQAWLNHGRILDCELSTQAARELVRRFGGDPSSADWRHFGRLAGFTNQKPQRRLDNGLPPFVHLRESSGRVYERADDFLKQVVTLAAAADTKRAARSKSRSFIRQGSIRRLAEFHGDSRYDGDLHRADMAWALYAASHGFSEEEIQSEILHARDLSKKGRFKRQLSYAERTASKAVTAATDRSLDPLKTKL